MGICTTITYIRSGNHFMQQKAAKEMEDLSVCTWVLGGLFLGFGVTYYLELHMVQKV